MEDICEEYENELIYSPDKGNIVFCSAIDCWAFTISDFAEIFS